MNDRFHHLRIEPADFEASLAFYCDVLGWAITRSWGGDGAARGAILSGGGVKVVIGEPAGVPGPRPAVHLDIHDVDARFRKLPAGTDVLREPEATPWGTRWFVIRDPDGTVIAFEEVHRFVR
ncbi:MAG TPA: VOC family protein [Myxococcota bacterium]|nr:VOC family protein [Myxococcota bacterium]